MVDADCSEVPQSDGVYDWTRTDRFHAVVSCTETCCGGGGEDGESTCGTTENARPDSFFFSFQDVTTDDYLSGDVEWGVEEACEGFLVSGSTPLTLEHRYDFKIDTRPIATFDVVEEGGCSVGGRSSGGAPVLLLLGFVGWVARRRSR